MGNRKPQFAVTRFQFHVTKISNFSKAFSSVKFISFLFSQNIIHIGIVSWQGSLRRNQKAYEAWAPQPQRNIKVKNKMKFAE